MTNSPKEIYEELNEKAEKFRKKNILYANTKYYLEQLHRAIDTALRKKEQAIEKAPKEEPMVRLSDGVYVNASRYIAFLEREYEYAMDKADKLLKQMSY